MYYQRQGFPQEDDIVLCRVDNITRNSVFAQLVEFPGKTGLIHISEVAPGRIRNLRDYVTPGRQVVCKVLRVDIQKGYINLSLRRVNSHQRQEKMSQIKQELKAEQMIKQIAKAMKRKPEVLYKAISKVVLKEYEHLFDAFQDIVSEEYDIEKAGLDKKIADQVIAAAKEKFKPQKITIQGVITFKTYAPNGVEQIKETLLSIEKVSETVSLHYLGAGRFKLAIEDFDYKDAEKTLKASQKLLEKFNGKLAQAAFERDN